MIQGAQAQRGQRPDQIGADVERIEGAIVGEQALDYFRAQTEGEGYGKEGEIERSSASGI